MEYPIIGGVDDQDISNISYYAYKYLDSYQKMPDDDSRYSHLRANVIGEMYEYLIYEKLMKWAAETAEVDEFILKGPYVAKDNKPTGSRFTYDAKLQIYYMSGGETIGEFDALFKINNKRYFVEITNTETKNAIKAMKSSILRKRNLLHYLFPNDAIYCWIITNYSGRLGIGSFPNMEVIRTPKYELDPDVLRMRNESIRPVSPNIPKYKSVYELQYRIFDYYRILEEIHKQVKIDNPEIFVETLKELVKSYAGLIERFFIGKMSAKRFIRYLKDHGYKLPSNIRITKVFFAFKINEDLSSRISHIKLG